MVIQKTITFRSQVTGNIADLIRDEGLTCQPSQDFLCALVGELPRYRDEGVELTPTILFSDDIDSVINRLPGAVKYFVGESKVGPDSVKNVLKDCAPLAIDSWHIFIERTARLQLKYGVFYYPTLPTTLPINDAISMFSNVVCVLVTKTSPSTINISGSKGSLLSVIFSTTREEHSTLEHSIEDFAKDCFSNIVASEDNIDFKKYFSRLLNKVLTESHGTILICTQEKLSNVNELKDGVFLNPELNFFSTFSAYQESSSAESLAKLYSCEKLLNGLLTCDGTVVFDTFGSVIAYRVFYRPETINSEEPTQVAVGGARRRAFEGIKGLIKKKNGLVSALFRSQDGLTMYVKENND